MNFASIVFGYVGWHYGRAFQDILSVSKNLLWFIAHFFSIPLLLKTLFQPWKRIHEEHRRVGLEDLAATIVVNIMTRIVGAMIRLTLIGVGLVFLGFGIVTTLVFCAIWVGAPFVIPGMFLYGITLVTLAL